MNTSRPESFAARCDSTATCRFVALALASSLLLGWITAATAAPDSATAPSRKNEIKLFVTVSDIDQALKVLNLDEADAVRQTVCFFETADGALEARHVILRARQKNGKLGDSTVKIRVDQGASAPLTEAEMAITPEQDWTNEAEASLSRSKDKKRLPMGLVPQVAAGDAGITEIFGKKQKKLVAARMGEFDWNTLKRYGPVETEVWREYRQFDGFPEKVTIERWHLQKDGKTLEILEVSTKTIAETEEQAKAMAKQFFGAARAAGLGEPSGQTKTRMVLDFFKPGR